MTSDNIVSLYNNIWEIHTASTELSRELCEKIFYAYFSVLNVVFKYTTSVYFFCFKFFVLLSDDTTFENNISNYILVEWFKIAYSDINLYNSMDFNTFYKSVFLDNAVRSDVIKIGEYLQFDMALMLNNDILYFLEHPEIIAQARETFLGENYEYYVFPILNTILFKPIQMIASPAYIFIHFSMVVYAAFIICIFLLDIKQTIFNNKYNTDVEQNTSLLLTESEKEIGSIDDILPLVIIITLVFGWYFYVHCTMHLILYCNSQIFTFVIIPIFFCFVFVIPGFLLFDFGVYLYVYLRGSGTTAMMALELMYDLINLFAFYIRVVIQCARLILMMTAIGSYQEYVYYMQISPCYYLTSDNVTKFVNTTKLTNSTMLDLFFKLVIIFMYIIYEIFHTYFVITIQTIAFFAMVFWLFFYLFTFFVSEEFETYFKKRRIFYDRLRNE